MYGTKILENIPEKCKTHLDEAFRKDEGQKIEDYHDMNYVVGVHADAAAHDDFQKYFRCNEERPNLAFNASGCENCSTDCIGLQFPPTCSVVPCDECLQPPECKNFVKLHLIKVWMKLYNAC